MPESRKPRKPTAPRQRKPPGAADGESQPELIIRDVAAMTVWLRKNIGRGHLSSLFARNLGEHTEIVHCPREGEDGYVPLTDDKAASDGIAQVRRLDPGQLTARIQLTYDCRQEIRTKDGQPLKVPAMFPERPAKVMTGAADMLKGLRTLRGVIHAPMVRADGTVLDTPGHDRATGLYYLPAERDMEKMRPVPACPSAKDVRDAVALLNYPVSKFPFVHPDHLTNWLGLLLTPMLRELSPGPYKMGAFDAHEAGSGKTLLVRTIEAVYGGVFRSELPEDKAEFRKQITSILHKTTSPVVIFDNVRGVLRSSVLEGLLTSAVWDDRPLGRTGYLTLKNDRLWLITGNNLQIGGDAPRRVVSVAIDPETPNPHLRTFDFNPVDWTRAHRTDIVRALLVVVRHWVAEGRPVTKRPDEGFGTWLSTVDGILGACGVAGTFDSEATRLVEAVKPEDEDWAAFLRAVYDVFADETWTVSDLVRSLELGESGKLKASGGARQLSPEDLPGELPGKARGEGGPAGVARSLGRWCANHRGQWVDGLSVHHVSTSHGVKVWQVRAAGAEPAELAADGSSGPGATVTPLTGRRGRSGERDRPPRSADIDDGRDLQAGPDGRVRYR